MKTVKFVKNDEFIMFEYDYVTNNEKVTASSKELIKKYNEFVQRENSEEWVTDKGYFYADVDGLEGELGFTRINVTK